MENISFADIAIVSCGTLSLELNHLKKEGFLESYSKLVICLISLVCERKITGRKKYKRNVIRFIGSPIYLISTNFFVEKKSPAFNE